MLLLSILLQLVIASHASVIFEDCGSAYELESVNIRGCGRSLPCYITLGEEVPVSVDFFADFSSIQLDQDVKININYLYLDTVVSPDPCEIVDCPVPTDCVTSFTTVMSVPSSMALNQRGYLRWRVYNEQKRLVLCYSVLVQTQSVMQKRLRQLLGLENYEDFSETEIQNKEILFNSTENRHRIYGTSNMDQPVNQSSKASDTGQNTFRDRYLNIGSKLDKHSNVEESADNHISLKNALKLYNDIDEHATLKASREVTEKGNQFPKIKESIEDSSKTVIDPSGISGHNFSSILIKTLWELTRRKL